MNPTSLLNFKILPQLIHRFGFHCMLRTRLIDLAPNNHHQYSVLVQKSNQLPDHLLTKRYVQNTSQNFRMPKTPDLIYMPHVLRWMKSKLRLKYLKKSWDPDFSEGAFIYGTTQAVCRITEIISQDDPEELTGLMTISARIRLEDEMKHRLTQQQKDLVRIRPDDIKIFVPTDVHLVREGVRKRCSVALRVLALKWHEQTAGSLRLVLVAIQCEFTREFAEGVKADWTISNFSVLECSMLSEAAATR